jgi:hypothetical protein
LFVGNDLMKFQKRNEKIRKIANTIFLAGTVVLTISIFISSYLYLTQPTLSREVINIVFFGFLGFIVLCGASLLTNGFEQKILPKPAPVEAVKPEKPKPPIPTDTATGSRFLHTKDVDQKPTVNPFLPK